MTWHSLANCAPYFDSNKVIWVAHPANHGALQQRRSSTRKWHKWSEAVQWQHRSRTCLWVESLLESPSVAALRARLQRTRSEPRLPSILLECVLCPWRCCSAGFSPSPSTCSNRCSWHCDGLWQFKSPRHFMLMILKCIVNPPGATWQSSYTTLIIFENFFPSFCFSVTSSSPSPSWSRPTLK